MKSFAITVASFAVIFAIGSLVIMSGGKSMSTDLGLIGQGKPVLVLAYENYSPAGGDALNRLRKVKGDYYTQLNFVVADMGNPQGMAFANRHQLIDGQAIFLNQHGQPLKTTHIPEDEQELRRLLDAKLAMLE